jgi:signal transduction histidine kinase
LPEAHLDRELIYDAILNIVDNAVDACSTQENAAVSIRVSADADANMAEVCIRDNGPGIPPDIRERVFEEFFTTKGKRGTGLGLSGARHIVEAHDGTLELSSQPGETVFCLKLPLDPARF